MDDNVFRIVITVGVGLVAIAMIAQAIAMSLIYRISNALHQRVESLLKQVDPVLRKVEPMVERAGPLMEKAGGALEKAGVAAEGASGLLASIKVIVEDNRPKVSQVCGEAVAIAATGREQVERIGELIYDAGGRARNRLEQIDTAVENTVEQVEHAGDSIRKAVLRPVREVNGLAAGISAAVSTLVRGPRRSSVEAATQDEEMFI
jgi:hypothetical protein